MTIRRRLSPFAIASTLLAPLLLVTPATAQLFPAPPPPPCDEWGTGYFFQSATPERVRECLAAGADPGTPNPDGVTPLHLAAHQNDNPDIVTILVDAGADPNARGPSGMTPLHMSWSRPRSTRAGAVVRELLRLGADPLAVDDRGWVADPTHCDHWNTGAFSRFAVRADFARCLDQGADVFAREDNFPFANDGGYTVLHHATTNEDPSIIALLVDAGADLEARNDRGYTPLHSAIGNGNLGAVTALLDAGANIEADAGGIWGTPLISATVRISGTRSNRNAATMAIIDALLAAGADVNAVDEDGDSPLLNVLRDGRIGLFRTTGPEPDAAADAHVQAIVDLVFRLLEAGADPGVHGAWGQTPLHEAAEYRISAPVQVLLDAGADPDSRDEYGASPLHQAARIGSPEIIALLASAGGNPNGQTEVGTSPLHIAVTSIPYDAGSQEQTGPWRLRATALLEAGADPNLQDAEGDTPLHLAAQEFDTALVSLLTDAGADVNARNERGETPLLTARNHANLPVARKLLDLGADPSVLEGTGGIDGPLCNLDDSAFLLRSPAESLRDCLEAGFPVNTPGSFALTPLMRLAGSSPGSFDAPEKIALLLAAGADPNARRDSGRTPLHLVAEADRDYYGRRKWAGAAGRTAAAALLDAGADVNARDTQGETPLHIAVRQEDDSATFMVALLIEAGADSDARANDGQTPLHLAASLDDEPAISVLLEAGAEVDARTNDGLTPLQLALQGGRRAAVATLLEAGADPDARDGEGRLVDPASCERWGTVAFFVFATADVVAGCLEAGEDPRAVRPQPGPSIPLDGWLVGTDRPNTPLHVAAAQARDAAVITALVQAGADVNARDGSDNTPLHEAAANGTPGVVRALLEAGAEVDARPRRFDPYSGAASTPLHYAARNPDPEVAAALLEAGADVNARGRDGETPLHYAAQNRNPALAQLLLDAGADVNAPGSDGLTPLHSAAAGNSNPAVLAVLLAAGADVHARGAYNRTHAPSGRVTPLHNAAYWNSNPEIVTMLVAAGADPDGGPVSPRPPVGPDTFMRLGDSQARSPISLAASDNPNPAVIEALVRAGVDLERTGSSGRTVLHDAAGYIPRAFPLLLRLGANPEARDAEGRTPMDLARANPLLQPWERVRMPSPLGRR